MTKTFRDLGVDGALCDALATEGITHPFPIQELTLPLALSGNDLIGQARTGTGKTLAFGLPLLQRLDPTKQVTQALVIVPTRELCLQVFEDLKIGAARGLTSIAVYGGVGYDEQIDALTTGVHVVVGTPGRLLDHLNRGNLDLSNVTQLVLDEADEMLDMGFLADVERLVEASAGTDRHTMLFSATMPTQIVKLARRYMDHPTFTRADTEAHETAPNVTQYFLQVHRMDKPRVLARILQSPGRGGVYVFVRTKHMADRLVNELEELRIPAIPIHGDLRQSAREKNLDRFREGKATVLVCTEVAARGLDVSGVTHVVNYDCPDDEKMYLHRIGRTARAGEAGVAVTFAEFNEVDKLNVIRKAVGAANAQVEQVFSTSDVLTELFELPDDKPWAHLSKKTGSGGQRAAAGGRREGSGRSDAGTASRPGAEGRGTEAGAGRSRDGERTKTAERGSGERSGRREGRSDGRPKSERRAEGTGGGHDADRSRSKSGKASEASEASDDKVRTRTRTRSRGRDTARDNDSLESTTRDDAPVTADANGRGRDDASTRGGQRTRAGGRARVRASSAGKETPTEPRGGREPQPKPADAPAPAREAAGEASTTKGEGRKRSGSTEDRDRGRGGEQRGGERGGAKRKRGERGGRSQRTERDRDRRSDRGTGGAGEKEPIKLEQRGPDARGEGQPQLARRVKVEHLP